MRLPWVNPLVTPEKVDWYLSGSANEVLVEKKLLVTHLDSHSEMVLAKVDRRFLLDLLEKLLANQKAVELAQENRKQVDRVFRMNLPVPNPEDDLFFKFVGLTCETEPKLKELPFSIVAQEVSLIERELILRTISCGESRNEN